MDADGRRTDGRRLDGYTISSPCEPKGSGELIIEVVFPSHVYYTSFLITLSPVPWDLLLPLVESVHDYS